MYHLKIRARAVRMMQESYEWYEGEQAGLGEAFLSSLDEAYVKLATHPEYFSIIEKQYRQIKLSRFPYVVVYEIIQDQVIVFALFHTSRNPVSKLRVRNK
jgi:plasmid stabilization system protein ParE